MCCYPNWVGINYFGTLIGLELLLFIPMAVVDHYSHHTLPLTTRTGRAM